MNFRDFRVFFMSMVMVMGPNAAGNRGDPSGNLLGRIEIHVSL